MVRGGLEERLWSVLVIDPEKRPGRFNPTFERICEILEVTLPRALAGEIIKDIEEGCREIGSPPSNRAPIDEGQGRVVMKVVMERLMEENHVESIEKIISLLDYSEISSKEAIEIHEEHKIPVSHLEKDIIPVYGDGVWIVDINGKRYLDLDSNYSAANLGYSNRELALGLFNQASQLVTMKEDRVQVPRALLMKTLISIMPKGLDQFYFQNSGGEAVDKCLKFAKAYTRQTGVVAMYGCFHGRTHGAVAVTSNEKYRKPFGLDKLDWVHFVPFNDLEAVEEKLQEGKAKIVILELVQGEEGGINPAHPDYARGLRKLCTEYGALLIVDEVQTGFGRVAMKEGQWWASDYYGIVPDLMAIGKSFGGGFPVTAVVTNKEIASEMMPGYDGSTFGGNPLAMISATIAIQQMKRLNITKNVAERGRQLMEGLREIKTDLIREVRGLGLFIGIVFPTKGHVVRFQEELKKLGVKSSLSTKNVARFLPPLIISEEEVDFLLDKVKKALKRMEGP
ncbi:aspartate aminotransferase family protein [Candidatus Bathyarchaeota archaeon]|nr:MAG: aspartate aminotransferase family protein [Candidatus Bathyarchaeota archaeon]